jgi:hypothetical protein
VRRLEEALDPIVRRMADANLKAPVDPPTGAERTIAGFRGEAKGDPEAAAAFLETASKTGRNRALTELMSERSERYLTLRVPGGAAAPYMPATPIFNGYAVVCASAVPEGIPALVDDRGLEFSVVARAQAHDLLLVRAPDGHRVRGLLSARAPTVGTLVAVRDQNGRATAGVISAPARRISEWNARALAASAEGNPLVRRVLEGAKSLARLFGSKEIEDLVAQIEAAQKMQRGFAAASTGRGFERVLSHDAPVAPALAGSPLVDLDGNLVGVHIANAHFGTSYAVPIEAVQEAFAAYLSPWSGTRPVPHEDGAQPGASKRRRPTEPRNAPAPERRAF